MSYHRFCTDRLLVVPVHRIIHFHLNFYNVPVRLSEKFQAGPSPLTLGSPSPLLFSVPGRRRRLENVYKEILKKKCLARIPPRPIQNSARQRSCRHAP